MDAEQEVEERDAGEEPNALEDQRHDNTERCQNCDQRANASQQSAHNLFDCIACPKFMADLKAGPGGSEQGNTNDAGDHRPEAGGLQSRISFCCRQDGWADLLADSIVAGKVPDIGQHK